jgi:hypothetical protein
LASELSDDDWELIDRDTTDKPSSIAPDNKTRQSSKFQPLHNTRLSNTTAAGLLSI